MLFCHRYKTAQDIPAQSFKAGREISGTAVAVADGDGLRLYHQPSLCCCGSEPNIPRGELQAQTIKIRLAGIDAPEVSLCLTPLHSPPQSD